MTAPMDEDVFSHILLNDPDSKTVHAVLLALPMSHLLFPACVYLDTYDARSAEASNAGLDLLLRPEDGQNRPQIPQFILHLVVATEHDKYWNAEQVELDSNGKGMDETEGAQQEPELTPEVDEQDHEGILDEEAAMSRPSMRGSQIYSKRHKTWSLWITTIFPASRCPPKSRVCLPTMIDFANSALTVSCDETPAYGPRIRRSGSTTGDYVFSSLGLPAVERFELVLADITLSKSHAGPVDLVGYTILKELSLDESGDYMEQELWEAGTDPISTLVPITKIRWREYLHAALEQLERLRVGFGPMVATEVGLALGTCNPEKLTQFGFQWNWRAYGHDESISPALLTHLARFPHLTDVHILFPRPVEEPSTSIVDALITSDVAAIFGCNGRHLPRGHRQLGRVGTALRTATVRRSFRHSAWHRGHYTPDGEAPWVQDNGWTPERPERGPEIENLRDLLQRIME
ncbi:hypothetical protein DFH09DRAFT_1373729 [Mycena vulgaris]|nr:hypothetical protein DFH09DRAFT_1373729 [Mycena vulgaris]